jgi:hypothetical protein
MGNTTCRLAPLNSPRNLADLFHDSLAAQQFTQKAWKYLDCVKISAQFSAQFQIRAILHKAKTRYSRGGDTLAYSLGAKQLISTNNRGPDFIVFSVDHLVSERLQVLAFGKCASVTSSRSRLPFRGQYSRVSAARVLHLKPIMFIRECTSNGSRQKPIFLKSAILFLLLAVGILSTLTRVSQYYPESSSARYVSAANKMNVAHPVPVLSQKPLHLVTRITPPQPAFRAIRPVELEIPFSQRIGIVVSLRHRSPPSCLA